MLQFYGFQVSVKSDTELQQERNKKAATELKAAATETKDPLIESASVAAEQKTVDTGHRTAATEEAVRVVMACSENSFMLTTITGPDQSHRDENSSHGV
jgi:hypothetical protein